MLASKILGALRRTHEIGRAVSKADWMHLIIHVAFAKAKVPTSVYSLADLLMAVVLVASSLLE